MPYGKPHRHDPIKCFDSKGQLTCLYALRVMVAKKRLAQKRWLRRLLVAGSRPLLFPLGGREEQVGLVSLDPSIPGGWRMTRFLPSGEPVGHAERETFKDALLAVLEYADDWAPEALPLKAPKRRT